MSEVVYAEELSPTDQRVTRDRWLGIMAAIAVAWYSFSLLVIVIMLSAEKATVFSLYTPEQLAYLAAMPFMVNVAHVVSVGAGLIGSAYLMLRRKSAYYWFAASLVCLLIMMLDASLRGGFDTMGASLMGISTVSFIIGIYLFWAAYSARNQGALNAT